jgi:FlaA1/EpsC-like NDP-sugar epimerase
MKPRLEELLRRESIRLDASLVRSQIEGARLLVTGAGGSIGSALSRRLLELRPARLIALDSSEQNLHELVLRTAESPWTRAVVPVLGDLQRPASVDRVLATHRPRIIFHTAAFKHVPLLERQPLAAVRNNLVVTRDLLHAARRYEVRRLIMTSTDKAVLPQSMLGATKRLAELVLLAHDGSRLEATSVRLCNVWGSRGSVIERFCAQVRRGEALTVTDPDATRLFISREEAVAVSLAALAFARGRDLLIPDVAETLSIGEIAEFVLRTWDQPVSPRSTRIIGLRPGDKLSESLVHPEEQTEATEHPGLRRIVAPLPDADEVARGVAEIDTRLARDDVGGVVDEIREMLRDFRPGKRLRERCGEPPNDAGDFPYATTGAKSA